MLIEVYEATLLNSEAAFTIFSASPEAPAK
jgi:hypothetical protein